MAKGLRTDATDILRIGQRIVLTTPHYKQPIEGELVEIGVLYLGIAVNALTQDEYISAPVTGSPINVKVYDRDGLYQTTLNYRGNTLLPKKMFYIDKPEAFERQQHRQYVRIPVNLPIHYITRNIYNGFNDPKDSTLVNISGNGLCFISDTEIMCPSTISIIIEDLPNMGKLPISADVVRCQEIVTPLDNTIYHVGVSFEDYLTRADRSRLLRALTVLQRSHLQKGLR